MCARTLVNRSIEVDEVTLLIPSMFSLEGFRRNESDDNLQF